MQIGVPREIMEAEYRVGLTPEGARTLVSQGHGVLVQKAAGAGSGFADSEYEAAGAKLVNTPAESWKTDLVIKIKEPKPNEFGMLGSCGALFTYLHLAAHAELTRTLIDHKTISIAYETVRLPDGGLPLLKPMSVVAGKLAAQIGAHYSLKHCGGGGLLAGGLAGVPAADFLIIGTGAAGMNAAQIARGLGASVTLCDKDAARLKSAADEIPGCQTLVSEPTRLAEAVRKADVVICAVLVAGAKAPMLISYSTVKHMKPGAVLVDISVDQGGATDISLPPTTHGRPVRYVSLQDPLQTTDDLKTAQQKFGGRHIIVYSVANMPGAVPRTSTLGITNLTLPYIQELAKLGIQEALKTNKALAEGVNTYKGNVTCQGVATALNLPFVPLSKLVA